LVLGGVILVAGRGRFARTPTAELAEWGMVCTLAVLCSPLAWTYFYVWLLPAWAAIIRFLTDPTGRRGDKLNVVISAAVAGILLALAVTEQFDPTLQAFGTTCCGAVAIFLTCGWVVRCEGRRVSGGPRLRNVRRKEKTVRGNAIGRFSRVRSYSS
jgi:alpha-1,2-mannosyltransferase